jgi:TRAP-type mannitol/chloroaromatic compound transport system permease small subunit
MSVGGLLKLSRAIDTLNTRLGAIATWLVLLACLLSAGNAFVRYGLNALLELSARFNFLGGLQSAVSAYGNNANAFLEAQWYMFTGMVLLGGPLTLKFNEHVRVDLVFSSVSPRARIWIDIVGGFLFLLPICLILIYFTWPWFTESFRIHEGSSNPGGLIRWPVKLLLPIGFGLMALQGISEIIKRVAALANAADFEFTYERPLQ